MKKATDIILCPAGAGRVALPVIVDRDLAGEKRVDFLFPGLLTCGYVSGAFPVNRGDSKKLKREPRVSRGRARRCNRVQISR